MSFTYFAECAPKGFFKETVLGLLIMAALASYVYNFYPVVRRYIEERDFYTELTEELIDDGVECLYVDSITPPSIAALSNDKIVSGTFFYDLTCSSGSLLTPVPYLRPIEVFDDIDAENSLIVMSDHIFNEYSSQEYLDWAAPSEYREELMSKLTLVRTAEGSYTTLYFYSFSDPSLIG